MRQSLRALVLLGVLAPSLGAQGQPPPTPPAPPLMALATSRTLLLPSQEVAGVRDTRAWMTRFDSVLTSYLEDGGIGTGWAYPRDAMRYARQNPTYTADPRSMGAQPFKSDKVKKGFALPEPFGMRARTLTAIGNARDVVVPVVARIDSTKTPRKATIQVTIVDPKGSQVVWSGILETTFDGGVLVAADSLASAVARLFVSR